MKIRTISYNQYIVDYCIVFLRTSRRITIKTIGDGGYRSNDGEYVCTLLVFIDYSIYLLILFYGQQEGQEGC